MKTKLLLMVMMLVICSVVAANELTYQGAWKTTNRKLDGHMTCIVTPVAEREWRTRFHGRWQAAPFDYTVDFTGPANDLRGTANIDGATYECRASINHQRFKANFTGDRYTGSFDLQRTETPTASGTDGPPPP